MRDGCLIVSYNRCYPLRLVFGLVVSAYLPPRENRGKASEKKWILLIKKAKEKGGGDWE